MRETEHKKLKTQIRKSEIKQQSKLKSQKEQNPEDKNKEKSIPEWKKQNAGK